MGKGRPTLADIAVKAGVSPTTVSFVVNGRDMGISEETSDRIWRAACELGYVKASRMPPRGWIKVAYLTRRIESFNFHTSFFANVYSHLQSKAMKGRMELLLLEFDPASKVGAREQRLADILSTGAEVFLTNDRETASVLLSRKLKTVLVQSGEMEGCVCVHCDDYEAGRLAAAHALENGHSVAGTIFPERHRGPRFDGFVEYFEANGGKCPERFHWSVCWSHAEAARHVERMASECKRIPSFIYCFADNLMFPAIRGLTKAGFKIPEDVSVMGTDNLYWGAHAVPAFSTVDLCEEAFSDRLVEAIAHVAAGKAPYKLAVPVRLLPRETVRRLK